MIRITEQFLSGIIFGALYYFIFKDIPVFNAMPQIRLIGVCFISGMASPMFFGTIFRWIKKLASFVE